MGSKRAGEALGSWFMFLLTAVAALWYGRAIHIFFLCGSFGSTWHHCSRWCLRRPVIKIPVFSMNFSTSLTVSMGTTSRKSENSGKEVEWCIFLPT